MAHGLSKAELSPSPEFRGTSQIREHSENGSVKLLDSGYIQPGDSSGLKRYKKGTKDFNLKASYKNRIKGGQNIKMEPLHPNLKNKEIKCFRQKDDGMVGKGRGP